MTLALLLLADPVRVLFLGSGGHHEPSERATEVVAALTSRGIHFTYADSLDALAQHDVLLIYANIDELGADDERALLDFVSRGGGLVAVHCASGCFRNSDRYIELIGAQFESHGTGTFRSRIVEPDHELMRGYAGFESWDETYVHRRHTENRTVLEMRDDEPWTWVRAHGEGRVFYTAWGHDHRTWSNPGFHELLERAVRWVSRTERAGPPPESPLTPDVAVARFVLPPGFEARLFAAEPDIVNPIAITWDERGRLWVAESLDYPNELGRGRDRIKICEDTDGDGRADKFTLFADGLSVPTSLVRIGDGAVVFAAPQTLFYRDTDADDVADVREELFRGWRTWDTHAGPSNFRYGHDGWLWGTVGYAGFEGRVGGTHHEFGQGIVRVRPDGSELEFVGSTSNNTWGLGIDEAGEVYVSTANGDHIGRLDVPNRYIEEVCGWSAPSVLMVRDHARLHPVTDAVLQVDFQRGYTAACGAAVYTGRAFPREYWNRAVFVCEPTGHLVHQCFVARDGWNLVASDDPWFAPVAAEVGPDGAVWIADWYSPVVQHNPYEPEHRAGKGNAYETTLRDGERGRIWRIVWRDAPEEPSREALFWRLTEQRLRGGAAEPPETPREKFLRSDPTVEQILAAAAEMPTAATIAAARRGEEFLKAVAASEPSPNLVPDFEERAAVRHYSGEATHRRVDDGRTGGCLEIASEDGSDSSWHVDVPVKRRTNYRMSAWVKTRDIEPIGDAYGALLNIHMMAERTITQVVTGTRDWTYVECVFNTGDVDVASVNCLIGGWGRARGTAWWDDVSLVEVSPAEAMAAAVRRHLGLDAAEVDAAALLAQLAPENAPERNIELLRSLARSRDDAVGAALIAQWERIGEAAKSTAVEALFGRLAWTKALLDAIESEAVNRGDVSTQQWYQLTLHTDEAIAARAARLRSETSADRRAVVEQFAGAATRAGDAERGRRLFRENCATCHESGRIGPDLKGVAERPKVDLLVDILDPNRTVEANYRFWTVVLKDGATVSGRLDAESRTTIDVTDLLGERHTIPRERIESMSRKSASASIMAEGWEKLGDEGLADVLEFVKSLR